MSRKYRNLALASASLVAIVCITTAVFVTRASVDPSLSAPQTSAPDRNRKAATNVLRQTEVARLNRRLGKRFGPSGAVSVVSGKLTIDGNEQPITITRRQEDDGENVEFHLAGRVMARHNKQARMATNNPTDKEALILERLTCDSPDYFVLAQLQGASYYTVTRNLRPDDAPDNYDGPLWTVVRVSDPLADEQPRLSSSWRLFYLNTATGLIDKVVSEEQGQRIEASFSDWTEQAGEKFPATITWTNNGQTLMILNLANLSNVTR